MSRLLTPAPLPLWDNHVHGPEISVVEAGLKPIFPLKPQVIAFKLVVSTTETLSLGFYVHSHT